MTSQAVQLRADLIDSRIGRIAAADRRSFVGLVRAVRVELLLRARQGRSLHGVVAPLMLGAFAATTTMAMARGHAIGFVQTTADAREKTRSLSMEDVLEFLDNRADLSSRKIGLLEQQYKTTAIKAVQGLAGSVERKVQEIVSDVAGRGLTAADGAAMLRQGLSAAGLDIADPWAVETMYRTQVSAAYNAGRWEACQQPEIDDILWGYEYATVGDDRVRPTHEAMDGVRYPKDHPIWRRIWPPNGYNCRCITVEIFRGERIARTVPMPLEAVVDGARVEPGPDDGWEFNFAEAIGGTFR